MMARGGGDSLYDQIASLRQRIEGTEQKVTANEHYAAREIQSLREYIDGRFESYQIGLRNYVDQRILDITRALNSPTVNDRDPRIWVTIVILGLLSAGTFTAFIVWVVVTQGR